METDDLRDAEFGTHAEDMPDCCHDHCVAIDGTDYAHYLPYAWVHGLALYTCKRGHFWTCGWGHRRSGVDLAQRGRPHR